MNDISQNTDSEASYARRANRPFPRYSIEEALVLATAISEKNAGKPMNRLLLADAIGRKPSSIQFRDLLSSSNKYGLTKGNEKSDLIELDENGRKIVQPTSLSEEQKGKLDAAMTPPLFSKIYSHFNGAKFPSGKFFHNTLNVTFGVPQEYTGEVEALLGSNGTLAGIIRDISGSPFVSISGFGDSFTEQNDTAESEGTTDEGLSQQDHSQQLGHQDTSTQDPIRVKPIFIAHGKNHKPLEQLKGILDQFKIAYLVAEDEPHAGRPISTKVKDTMSQCGSAIFIFSRDGGPSDEIVTPNLNVTFELGAASVLYGDKIIMFKEDNLELPSDFSDLGYISFEKDHLNAKTMELFKELIDMGFVKITAA